MHRYQEEVECTASNAYLVIALFYNFTPSKEELDGREERKKWGSIPDSRDMIKLCPINEGCLDNMDTESNILYDCAASFDRIELYQRPERSEKIRAERRRP